MSYYDEPEYYGRLIEQARLERSKALGDAIATLAAAAWSGTKGLVLALKQRLAGVALHIHSGKHLHI